MANTIFNGERFRIPYYASTGTDLTSTGFLYYVPTQGVFAVNGTSDIFRGSAADLLLLGHYQSAAAANNSITMTRSRGSTSARTAVVAGDTIGNIRYNAVTNSSGTVTLAGGIRMVVDTGAVSAGSLNSKFVFSTRRGVTERTSLEITSQTTSTGIGTGGVLAYGGLSVSGPIYANNIFTDGVRVSTFDGNYNSLSNKPTVPTNLDSLTDVTITSPTNGQVLKFNGTNWVNGTDATGGGGGSTFSDTIKTSKGNLTPNFDINGSGTISSADALAYAKIASSSKQVTDGPVLTPHTWMEGDWATSTSSHGVIVCVEGNSINALRGAVSRAPLETGDTMFIGNVDSNQRASSGFFVSGDRVGMFGYDNNSEAVGVTTTSTMTINSTNDGTARWNIAGGHGGVRIASTTTISTGGLAVTGATGFMQTKDYADTAARDTAIPTPVAGMIVLVGTTFFGYNGSAWVAFN
jgi:hypothetical protein